MDFEMNKVYLITGQELLGLLALIQDDGQKDASKILNEIGTRSKDNVDLHYLASKKDPRAVMNLDSIYSTTDMPKKEYIAHLRIIAIEEGKRYAEDDQTEKRN